MNRAEIYRRVAGHLEENPGLYDFGNAYIFTCKTPMCIIGWCAHFTGLNTGSVYTRAVEAIGISYDEWFQSMMKAADEIRRSGEYTYTTFTDDAILAAKCLRRMADQEQPERNWAQEQYQKAINGPKLVEVEAA